MIRGSIVALVTPMLQNGDVDWNALEALLEWHIDKGTSAVVAVGTTGESATLAPKEHIEAIAFIVNKVASRIPVIAGTGANSTREAIELTQGAHEVGADASLLVTPYYNKPTQEGLFLHYQAIAKAVDMPHILYNVPGRTCCDLLPETVIKLAEIPNIIGIKEATGNIDRARQLITELASDFAVYSGDDGTAIELILAGGQGNISVTANVAPAEMSALCQLGLQGRVEEARELQQKLMVLHHALFIQSSPIPVKWALTEMGLIQSGIRLPLTPLSSEYHAIVRQALKETDLLTC